ncbi:substrate-binding domain-containing protein, partial [Xanthomonas citri pv. citri]|nr:substrate-binding domain-containing protein [Xanthomonas citri pv. citri]
SSHMEGGRPAFDGIFCVNDALAVRIRATLLELGLRVPEDVQLIGFDGIRQFAGEGFYCSTIVQPVPRLAETSVDLL